MADLYANLDQPDWTLAVLAPFKDQDSPHKWRVHMMRATAWADRLEPQKSVDEVGRGEEACKKSDCGAHNLTRMGVIKSSMQALIDEKIDANKDPLKAKQAVEKSQQYAHLSGLLVLTPDGRLSRYFYGIEYSPKELRLALFESGQRNIGSLVDELLLYCYHYDPANGRYGAVVMNLVRLGGVLTVGLIVGFIVLMRWRESRQVAERHA